MHDWSNTVLIKWFLHISDYLHIYVNVKESLSIKYGSL